MWNETTQHWFIVVFVCVCPAVLNQQILIMEMFIITLVNRFLYRRTYEAVETHDSEEDTTALPEATLMEHDV